MIRHATRNRADVGDVQVIDQEVAELERPRRQLDGPCVPRRIVGQKLRILELDHRRARARRDDDRAIAGEDLDRVLGLLAGQLGKAAVVERLAAAGLSLGKIDLVPQPPQQPHRGLPRLRPQNVAQAGDHIFRDWLLVKLGDLIYSIKGLSQKLN